MYWRHLTSRSLQEWVPVSIMSWSLLVSIVIDLGLYMLKMPKENVNVENMIFQSS